MKYRIQLKAVFNNTKANDLLNQVELIKASVFIPNAYTPVEIIRDGKKSSNEPPYIDTPAINYINIDFDAAQDTHIDSPSGIDEFLVLIDVSFTSQNDCYTLMNYIESIKTYAITGTSNNYLKFCRHFECKHDENPLTNDSSYIYVDFDGPQITY